MTFEVEDGTGSETANSYVSVADADAYHALRGNSAWTETSTSPDQGKHAALVRATQAIDALYRGRWPGAKLNGREQALEWPRVDADDANGEEIADDAVPAEIVAATCEAALRELEDAGSMMPDLERGGGVKRVKAGTVEVEFAGNASALTAFTIIDGILSPLLGSTQQPTYFGRAVRG